MKKLIILFMIFIFGSQFTFADDLRSKVAGSNMSGLKTNKIDPDKHVYGIPWGISEDEFIKVWGDPIGYVRFNIQETGMVYGSRHIFLFNDNKLSGVRITNGILDWQLSKKLMPNPIFDAIQWQLNNGIKEETDLSKVKEILGSSLSNERYEKYYETDRAKVTLNFSHYTNAGDNDEAFKVHAIMIEKK